MWRATPRGKPFRGESPRRRASRRAVEETCTAGAFNTVRRMSAEIAGGGTVEGRTLFFSVEHSRGKGEKCHGQG